MKLRKQKSSKFHCISRSFSYGFVPVKIDPVGPVVEGPVGSDVDVGPV